MGVWTWYQRYRALPDEVFDPGVSSERRDRLLSDLYCQVAGWEAPIATMDTHRLWHAIHVGLTGTELGGEAPAFWVVGGDNPPGPMAWNDLISVHSAERVRAIAAYLHGLQLDDVVARLYATIAADSLYVYSFADWRDGKDMVQTGDFAATFEELRAFYGAAASAGHVVLLSRG